MKAWRGFFLLLLIPAFLFMEVVNYSTNDYALNSLLPGMTFQGLTVATYLAIAMSLTDLAGLARVFTPESGKDEPLEVKILFWGWLAAAAFNMVLTWWGAFVSMSQSTFSGVMNTKEVLTAGPLVIAGTVFIVRVVVIMVLGMSLDHLLNPPKKKEEKPQQQNHGQPSYQMGPKQGQQQPMHGKVEGGFPAEWTMNYRPGDGKRK